MQKIPGNSLDVLPNSHKLHWVKELMRGRGITTFRPKGRTGVKKAMHTCTKESDSLFQLENNRTYFIIFRLKFRPGDIEQSEILLKVKKILVERKKTISQDTMNC